MVPLALFTLSTVSTFPSTVPPSSPIVSPPSTPPETYTIMIIIFVALFGLIAVARLVAYAFTCSVVVDETEPKTYVKPAIGGLESVELSDSTLQ